jgi:hypothetical protein
MLKNALIKIFGSVARLFSWVILVIVVTFILGLVLTFVLEFLLTVIFN